MNSCFSATLLLSFVVCFSALFSSSPSTHTPSHTHPLVVTCVTSCFMFCETLHCSRLKYNLDVADRLADEHVLIGLYVNLLQNSPKLWLVGGQSVVLLNSHLMAFAFNLKCFWARCSPNNAWCQAVWNFRYLSSVRQNMTTHECSISQTFWFISCCRIKFVNRKKHIKLTTYSIAWQRQLIKKACK